jgi:hypothetical protein
VTIDELPRWMRIWIVGALVLVVFGVVACIAMGIVSDMDFWTSGQ